MQKIRKLPLGGPLAAVFVALMLAGCAAQAEPPPPQYDLTPPQKRPLDAKTQLETGRRY